jgi:hypothetical protein
MLQLVLAASVVPQALAPVVIANSAGLVPPMAILPMFSVALPVFERVATIAEDVVFTVVLEKARDIVKDATGAAAAVTVTVTDDEVEVEKLLSPPYTAVMG